MHAACGCGKYWLKRQANDEMNYHIMIRIIDECFVSLKFEIIQKYFLDMHWRQSRRGLMWQSFDTVPLIEDIPQLLPICKISSSTQHSYLIQYTYTINKANSTTTLLHYSMVMNSL
jgi:hypothetical protein